MCLNMYQQKSLIFMNIEYTEHIQSMAGYLVDEYNNLNKNGRPQNIIENNRSEKG